MNTSTRSALAVLLAALLPLAAAAADPNACATAADCKGGLPLLAKRCPDGGIDHLRWACENNACTVASECPAPALTTRPAPSNVCASAADCKGPIPLIAKKCPDGSVAKMSWGCEKGTCELLTECPAKATGPSACTTAADCKGTIPLMARRCPDGGIDHLHWACEKSECTIASECAGGPAPSPEPGACTTAADCHGALSHLATRCPDGGFSSSRWECEAGRCEAVNPCAPPAKVGPGRPVPAPHHPNQLRK